MTIGRKHIAIVMIICLITGCIDPIGFDTGSEPRRLAVEGMITNNSFLKRLEFPGPAERFYVALRWTSPVGNDPDVLIPDARVELHQSEGDPYIYNWDEELKRYIHPDDGFYAEEGIDYFVRIILPSGEIYESQPEKLYPAPAIASVSETFTSRIREIEVGLETEFIEQRGVVLGIDLPEHSGETFFYRWRVIPSWVWESSVLPESSPVKTCYITDRYYFQKINVHADRSGGYTNDLFFLDTDDNDRVQFDFSALIIQYSLSPRAFTFWNEVALQQESGGGIFDTPPFPLSTNIFNVRDESEKVSGYFMAAHESALRWFINQDELPYNLYFTDLCETVPGFSPPEQCGNCLRYSSGGNPITNEKPKWWRDWK